MGISIDPAPPKKRYGGAIKPAIEAIQKIFAGSYVDTAFKVYDAVKAERSDDEDLGQRAWTLWRERLARTLEIFFETAYLTRRPDDKDEFGSLMAGLLSEAERLVHEDDVKLTILHLLNGTSYCNFV